MYDQPKVFTYTYPAAAIGSGTITRKIRVPKGATQARVLDIHAYATTTFNQVTTSARMQVGVAGTLNKFADSVVGALAAGDAQSFADTKGEKGKWYKETDDVAELLVTLVAPTGGTPAGVADVTIHVAWDFVA